MKELVKVSAWEEVVNQELHVGGRAEALELHQIPMLHSSKSIQLILEAPFGFQACPQLLHSQGWVVTNLQLVHYSIATLSNDVLLPDESQSAQHLLRSGHVHASLEHDDLPACSKIDFDVVVLPHPAHDENHSNYELESEEQPYR